MGMRMGTGEGIVESLREHGIPVLSVSTPSLFGHQRDRAFVDQAVSRSIESALAKSGAERIAVVGSSFGADIIGSGLGRVAPALRRRIASVVLVVPGTDVYFHANPIGIFYRGPAAADPEHTIPLLRGLPVTCIFGTEEDSSLCRHVVMDGARRIAIDDGHFMLFSRDLLAAAVDAAVLDPPGPMH
jgi:type IV secretory pathway VirJ component